MAIAVVALVVVGLSACSSSEPAAEGSAGSTSLVGPDDTASDRPTVAIVGDSITEWGQDVLLDELSGRWELDVDGRSGFTIAEQHPAAVALAEAAPSQMIVNLGTNDVLRHRSTEQVAADLQALLADLGGIACVHVVTVADTLAFGGYDYAPEVTEANQAITRLAAASGAGVIDWAGEVTRFETGSEPGGSLLFDTVHPNEAGQRRLAALYDDALGGCDG